MPRLTGVSSASVSQRPSATIDVLIAGDHLEPVPAAVAERRHREGDLVAFRAVERMGGHALRHALGRGTVDEERSLTARLNREPNLLDVRPLLPVRGRERVEVAREGDPLAGRHSVTVAGEHVVEVCAIADANLAISELRPDVGVDIEGDDVGVGVLREDDALDLVPGQAHAEMLRG